MHNPLHLFIMGEAELQQYTHKLVIRSIITIYGDAASSALAWQIANDISTCWNEPVVTVSIRHHEYIVKFDIEGLYEPVLQPEAVWYNDNPRLNFFRIEEFVMGNISFVDGIPCNTGYFKLDNLVQTGTTAAHEYGHTIGLEHPAHLDVRGHAAPGIMYPRGTICDPDFQYDPHVEAGTTGGTLNPRHRKVLPGDIHALELHRLHFNEKGLATIGDFSSIYHEKHQNKSASL
jgi:hypothetical protein